MRPLLLTLSLLFLSLLVPARAGAQVILGQPCPPGAAAATSTAGITANCVNISPNTWIWLSGGGGGGASSIPTGTDTGAVNAYVVATTPNTVGLTVGSEFTWKPANTNTGASTINVNGTGVKPLTKVGSNAVASGDLVAGTNYGAAWDGAHWVTYTLSPYGNSPALQPPSSLSFTGILGGVGGGSNSSSLAVGAGLVINTPFETSNAANDRNMIQLICNGGGATGCATPETIAIGFDMDGFGILQQNVGPFAFLFNPGGAKFFNSASIIFANQTGGAIAGPVIAINSDAAVTSGDALSVKNNGGGALFEIDHVTGQIRSSGNACASSASPAVCGNSWTGSVAIAAAATTLTVNTTAVGANSKIFLTRDDSLGTLLGVTCNTATVMGEMKVSARVNATSFTVTVQTAPGTNPGCLNFHIEN